MTLTLPTLAAMNKRRGHRSASSELDSRPASVRARRLLPELRPRRSGWRTPADRLQELEPATTASWPCPPRGRHRTLPGTPARARFFSCALTSTAPTQAPRRPTPARYQVPHPPVLHRDPLIQLSLYKVVQQRGRGGLRSAGPPCKCLEAADQREKERKDFAVLKWNPLGRKGRVRNPHLAQ